MNKITKTIYYIFITVIVTTAAAMIISIFPVTGNYKLMVVQSGSMEPAIKTGSVVVVKPLKNYQIGDVITFSDVYKTETPISHRITEVKITEGKYYYITKGDANKSNDPKEVSLDNVIGKVLFNVPYLGFLVQGARKPIGFALLIIIPGGIIVYDEAKKIWNEVKKMKKIQT